MKISKPLSSLAILISFFGAGNLAMSQTTSTADAAIVSNDYVNADSTGSTGRNSPDTLDFRAFCVFSVADILANESLSLAELATRSFELSFNTADASTTLGAGSYKVDYIGYYANGNFPDSGGGSGLADWGGKYTAYNTTQEVDTGVADTLAQQTGITASGFTLPGVTEANSANDVVLFGIRYDEPQTADTFQPLNTYTLTVLPAGPDNTPPTLSGSDIVDSASGGPVEAGLSITFTVNFSEDMDDATVTTADFGIVGTATGSVHSVNESSPGVFEVVVLTSAIGNLRLTVLSGADLRDPAGNPLDTSSAILDDTTLVIVEPTTPGEDPEELRVGQWIRPSPASSVLTQAGWHVWGGSVIEENGQYHMFYARWPVSGYAWGDGWLFASEVWHAVADSPGGPFTPTQMILGARSDPPTDTFWDSRGAHNPHIRRFGNKVYLYYTSTRDPGTGTWPGVSERNRLQRTQRIGVIAVDSVQDLLNGNFTRPASPILEPVTGNSAADDISTNPAPSAIPANRILNNPSVIERPDGKYQLIYKTNWPQAPGFAFGQALADSPAGPFTYVAGALLNDGGQYEDQFHWYDPVLGQYNLVIKRFGTGIDQFVSNDATNWTLLGKQSDLAVFKADGSYESLDLMERPQVFLGANGQPEALYTAVREDLGGGNYLSYNLQIPLAAPTATATVLDEEVDVLNTGVLVQAVNLGTTTPVTLNGLAFTPAGTDVAALAANYGFIQAGGAAGSTLAATTVDAAYEGLAAFENFLDSSVSQTGNQVANASLSFTLDDLVPGHEYRIQLFLAESRSSIPRHGPQLLELGGNRTIRFDFGPSSSLVAQGANGVRLLATFTAGSTSLPVTLRNAASGNGGLQLSAYALHEINAAPPPGNGFDSPFVDTDGDSYRDEAETALGSSPADANSIPDFTLNPAKPNVVIIYADDLGFGDISRYATLFGTPAASPTPNVDRLADEGVTFTQAHSANAVCTPSRYSLLTGIYNWRLFHHISREYGYKVGIDNIPADSDVTIAEFLKTQNYDTAAFGKWHLGGKWYAPGTNNRITGNPTNPSEVDWTRRIEGHAFDIGFDRFQGLASTINIGPYVYLHDDAVQYWVEDSGPNNEYGDKLPNGRKGYFRPATNSDTFTWFSTSALDSTVSGAKDSRASLGDPSYRQIDPGPILVADFERYIDDRMTVGDTDPFFAYVSLYSPHKPWATTPDFNNNSYGSYDYARFMAEVDHRIGRILAAIDDNGMRNNTLVIFTSDNGPETTAMERTLSNGDDANGPLRGAKRDIWEGGTRVPFIVRWPGQAPAGMVVTDELISQVDIFPTIAATLGADLPATTAPDGESFLNILRGQRKPGAARGGIVLASGELNTGHLALKTPDGWKLIDSTGGGGNATSWDSDNNTISNAVGTDQGTPKQLYEMPVDLGEDDNKISALTGDSAIRSELLSLTGRDLLGILDQLRSSGAASLDGREPDNDADGMSNSFETTHGLDRDSPLDAALDNDGDGADNLAESIAGTNPNDNGSVFRVINLADSPESFSVTWPSVAGRSYEVFWSTDLSHWTSDSTHPGTGSNIVVPLDKTAIDAADGISDNLRALFVRVMVSQ